MLQCCNQVVALPNNPDVGSSNPVVPGYINMNEVVVVDVLLRVQMSLTQYVVPLLLQQNKMETSIDGRISCPRLQYINDEALLRSAFCIDQR